MRQRETAAVAVPPSAPRLARVTVEPESDTLPAPESLAFRVWLSNGRRLEIPSGHWHEAELRRLLAILEEA